MDTPGAKTYFVPLCIVHGQKMDKIQVLFAEGSFAALFRSYPIQAYREIAPMARTWLRFDHGLNRSNPVTEVMDLGTLGRDLTRWRHERTLANCQQSGPMLIRQCYRRRRNGDLEAATGWRFTLLDVRFSIPVDTVREWRLNREEARTVWVEWDVKPKGISHPLRWAPYGNGGDCIRLGVRIFPSQQTRDNNGPFLWLDGNGKDACGEAAALVDFLEGKTFEEGYQLGVDRKNIFKSGSQYANELETAEKRRANPYLPFNDAHFVWGDNMHKRPRLSEWLEAEDQRQIEREQKRQLEEEKGILTFDEQYQAIEHQWAMEKKYNEPMVRERRKEGVHCPLLFCEEWPTGPPEPKYYWAEW